MPPRRFHALRELCLGDPGGTVAHQVLPREVEELRVGTLDLLAPCFESRAVHDAFGNQRIVEGEYRLFVHQHVAATRLVLERFDLCEPGAGSGT